MTSWKGFVGSVKKPIFNDIQWGELVGSVGTIFAILQAIDKASLPEPYKHYIHIGLVALWTMLNYLRNPKTLDWVKTPVGLPPIPQETRRDRIIKKLVTEFGMSESFAISKVDQDEDVAAHFAGIE